MSTCFNFSLYICYVLKIFKRILNIFLDISFTNLYKAHLFTWEIMGFKRFVTYDECESDSYESELGL